MDANTPRKARTRIPVGWTRGEGLCRQKNLALSEEAFERLAAEALGSRATEGTIIDALICRHLRRYNLTDRGPSDAEADARTRLDAIVETDDATKRKRLA